MLTNEQKIGLNEELEKFALSTITDSDPFILAKRDLIKARGELKTAKELAHSKVDRTLGVTAQSTWIANEIRAAKYNKEDAETEAQIESYRWNKYREKINTIKYLIREK